MAPSKGGGSSSLFRLWIQAGFQSLGKYPDVFNDGKTTMMISGNGVDINDRGQIAPAQRWIVCRAFDGAKDDQAPGIKSRDVGPKQVRVVQVDPFGCPCTREIGSPCSYVRRLFRKFPSFASNQ